MAVGVGAVQLIISEKIIFPSDRIVQRMDPRIAPMPAKIVRFPGRSRAGEVEKLLRGLQCDLGGENLGLRDGDRRASARCVGDGLLGDQIDRRSRLMQNGLGRVKLGLQMADDVDDSRIFRCRLDAGIDPWPRSVSNEG